MSESEYIKVTTLDEAFAQAAAHTGDYVYSGGGTDLQLYRKKQLLPQRCIIDISEIPQLRTITIDGDTLIIGSMVTLDELLNAPDIHAWCPLMTEAARSVATPVIRMTATVGGNLLVANRCTFYNQSRFWRESVGSCLRESGDTCLVTKGKDKCFSRNVSDLAPALIALGARVSITGPDGTRTLPLEQLYTGDGIRIHAHLDDAAILTEVRVTARPARWFYRKLRRRRSIDFTSLTVAAAADDEKQTRVCVNGMSMAPVLVEADLSDTTLEELQRRVRRACRTVDNDLLPLSYRREMRDQFIARLYREIAES
ncbi:MAG: hypothetical protein D6800_10820 [Candidatus Zixiibacteriota bacterium]|nr:MAG: hypothetical protein D6800_10820 [candidate division Zixibacteria bacterium]